MKRVSLVALIFLYVALLTGCNRVVTGDETADRALRSFTSILEKNKDRLSFHHTKGHWNLALDGDDKFEWVKDTALHNADFALILGADVFIDAGLDVNKLAGSPYLFNPPKVENGMQTASHLLYTYNVSDKRDTAQGYADAFRRLLKQNPAIISFHEAKRRYTLLLSDGFTVSWYDEQSPKADTVTITVAADPILDAGAQIDKLQSAGWLYVHADDAERYHGTVNQLIKSIRIEG